MRVSTRFKRFFVTTAAATLLVATSVFAQTSGSSGGTAGAVGNTSTSAQATANALQQQNRGIGVSQDVADQADQAARQGAASTTTRALQGSATSRRVQDRVRANAGRSNAQLNAARNGTRRAFNQDIDEGVELNDLDDLDIDIDFDDDDGIGKRRTTGQRSRAQMREDANRPGFQGTELQNRSLGNTPQDTDEEEFGEATEGFQGAESQSDTELDENGIDIDVDARSSDGTRRARVSGSSRMPVRPFDERDIDIPFVDDETAALKSSRDGRTSGTSRDRQRSTSRMPVRPFDERDIDIPFVDDETAALKSSRDGRTTGTSRDRQRSTAVRSGSDEDLGATDLGTRAQQDRERRSTSRTSTPRRPTNDQIPGQATGRPDNDELPGRAFNRSNGERADRQTGDDRETSRTAADRRDRSTQATSRRTSRGAERDSSGVDRDGFSDLRTRTGRNQGTRFDTDRPERMRDGRDEPLDLNDRNDAKVRVNTDINTDRNNFDVRTDSNLSRSGFDFDSLGVAFDTNTSGQLVVSTLDGDSFLADVGFDTGDILLSAFGQPIDSLADFQQLMMTADPGDRIPIQIMRDGVRQTIFVEADDFLNLIGGFDGTALMTLGLQFDPSFSDQLVVATVTPESFFARAGLLPGDVIRTVGGERITTTAQLQELLMNAENRVPIVLERNGRPQTIFLAPRDLQSAFSNISSTMPGDNVGAWLGVFLDVNNDSQAFVESIQPGSAAAQAGLQPGDVIVSINGQRITSRDQLSQLISELDPESQIDIDVERRSTRRLQATLGERPNTFTRTQVSNRNR